MGAAAYEGRSRDNAIRNAMHCVCCVHSLSRAFLSLSLSLSPDHHPYHPRIISSQQLTLRSSSFLPTSSNYTHYQVRGYRSVTIRNDYEDEDEDEDDDDDDDDDDDEEEEYNSNNSGSDSSLTLTQRFEEAVKLFNGGDYYACHDVLESLWYDANDPLRTLLHALLQSSVAFHHLFNQNHKGAMMELGEAVCKLRKLDFQTGPFHHFEQDISAVQNFIYQTQLELAACNEDFCVAMEQTERSYQLLEGYGAGQRLYSLERQTQNDVTYILFDPHISYGAKGVPQSRVKLPILQATSNHLKACLNY